MSDPPLPPLSVPNFRDAGAFVNEAIGLMRIKPGMVYRSARPDDASSEDRRRLRNIYRIRNIIDLRTRTEHAQQAQKRDARVRNSPPAVESNDKAAESIKIEGINYHEINFNGSAFNMMLLWKLSWWELIRLVSLMACGYRNEAIQILSPKLNAMGLVGLAMSLLEVSKPEIKQIFKIFAEERNYPVLVHCTQGKDRTGLAIMILLGLVSQNSMDAIEKDYLMSEKGLESERDEMLKELGQVGLSGDFTACDANMVKEVFGHIYQKYGNIEAYLETCGVDKRMQEAVRSILCYKSYGDK